ncbi:MAG: NAD(P)H-hydrate dehydratase [Lachnospiraceae bacterium]|nr:NAD(P)H-hydrate dehydratase [Candidatus Fimimorpha excrementavium]
MKHAENYILTSEQAREVDRQSIQEFGIPSLVLMERAALALAEVIRHDSAGREQPRILVAAGVGNNGADGLAAARILQGFGYEHISVVAVGNSEKATEEWMSQYYILIALGIPVVFWNQLDKGEYTGIRDSDLIIDALFGIGLKRDISGDYADVIRSINESPAKKYAADIPSGICASTGKVMGCAVKADVTVTFGLEKVGMVLYPGAEYAGRIVCRDIGFPKQAVEAAAPTFFTYTKEALKHLPDRPAYSNKGTFGKVLIIAGSPNMAGAAYLASKAAYAAGCGLVKILTDERNRTILQTLIPEAIMTTYSPEHPAEKMIDEALKWADALVLGPGISTSATAERMVRFVLHSSQVPMVIDADALNILAKHPDWWRERTAPAVATPHLGELGRLSGKPVEELKKNLVEEILLMQKELGVVLAAKDARTIVAGNEKMIYINTSGNSGMAKAGSGDVLTGIIAALLARKQSPMQAACLGVYLHGLAGDTARQLHGEYGMKASDLTEGLAEVLRQYSAQK